MRLALAGVVIGLAGTIFLLVNGRIMGASGIIGGLVDGSGRSNAGERAAFVAGLFILPAIIAFAVGGAETHLTSNLTTIIVAGLLVGFGARIANGCTSGHGVCGIGRGSKRSLAAKRLRDVR